jgi:hypothetical protein
LVDKNLLKIAEQPVVPGIQQKGGQVRRLRQIFAVSTLALLLAAGLVAGGLATSLFMVFGSDKGLIVEGPVINSEELQSCSVVVIDLERIDIASPTQLALLPNPLERLTVDISPEAQFSAGLFSRESADSAILGFDTCIATLESNSWVVKHSALGEPWFRIGDRIGFVAGQSGTPISFNATQASNSTLIISVTEQDQVITEVVLKADLSFPNANVWITGLAIISGALVALFIVLVVLFIVKSRRGPQV